MKAESGKSISAWMSTADVPMFGKLDANESADVCVIGGGIAGLTTAYLLCKDGHTVVLVDDGPICGGETQRTTAHLSNVIDDRFYEVQRIWGTDKARLAYESHSSAINFIEQTVRVENIDCDFSRVDGYLFLGDKQSEKLLKKELQVCEEIGFDGVEMLSDVPLERSGGERACLRFPRQGQFHVLKYLTGIARAIVSMGGRIYTHTHVDELKDGLPVLITTDNGITIEALHVVVATNSPVTDWVKIHTKQHPYRSYVIAGPVDVGAVPKALYWDTEEPYHYVRTQPLDDGRELLIIGGADHRTGQEQDIQKHYAMLEKWAKAMFPMLTEITHRWSGQVLEPIDGLALIGKDPAHKGNVYVITGDSGMGMTHGTIGAMMLSDAINGKDNPWSELYDPSRKPLKSTLDYVVENVHTAAAYLDYVTGDDVKDVAQIPAGSGAVMTNQGEHIAVYKDMQGQVFQCSAVCPHMKSLVRWNDSEKSWDCPAHGSRFAAKGQVINGPANCGLDEVRADKQVPPHTAESNSLIPPETYTDGASELPR